MRQIMRKMISLCYAYVLQHLMNLKLYIYILILILIFMFIGAF